VPVQADGIPGDFEAPRLYSDLAWLWPLWEGVEAYRAETEFYIQLVDKYSRIQAETILDMGCGGGKTGFHLKRRFQLTGVDISEAMLGNARRLNPDCEYLLGDMRTLRLGRLFDAVFINDAIPYMTTREDLLAVFRRAWEHLRPGGVMITGPDYTKETFVQNQTTTATGGGGDIEITFVENLYDPDPADSTCEAVLIFIIREKGALRIEQDVHVLGLFPRELWRTTLTEAGFEVHQERHPRGIEGAPAGLPLFACVKPG